MRRALNGIIEAGEPLIQQAIGAQRRFQAAKDEGLPVEEVERLRVEAESLFQSVTEYQLRSLGGPSTTLH
ncbi:hypothetical protein D3C80_2102360 [compost metagenome]